MGVIGTSVSFCGLVPWSRTIAEQVHAWNDNVRGILTCFGIIWSRWHLARLWVLFLEKIQSDVLSHQQIPRMSTQKVFSFSQDPVCPHGGSDKKSGCTCPKYDSERTNIYSVTCSHCFTSISPMPESPEKAHYGTTKKRIMYYLVCKVHSRLVTLKFWSESLFRNLHSSPKET